MVHQRYFNTGDRVTDYNLGRLDHLSDQNARAGELRIFETYFLATVDSLDMLPSAVRRHFAHVSPYIGAYDRHGDAWREATWLEMAAGLDEGLTAALADPSLTRGGGADLSDRPRSRGERLEAACNGFLAALGDGRSLDSHLREIENAATGTSASGDAAELKRLLGRKRIGWDEFRSKATGLAWHAREIANNLHHLK